jgi:hypothetical protein
LTILRFGKRDAVSILPVRKRADHDESPWDTRAGAMSL